MPRAFVTGATGFIGSHVAHVLLHTGWEVKALCRLRPAAGSPLSNDVEWVEGDLRESGGLGRAMVGCEAAFHVAADYRLWARNPGEIYQSNVQGTANVMEAAMRLRFERVVYTSSVGALGHHSDGTPADETTPVSLQNMVGHYKRSKFLAERVVEDYAAKGLPVVLVHPSTPVGPGDHKPTPTGKIIVDFLNRRMPAYLDTGLNLVHVRDVAEGHRLALEHGRIGEKYILGHKNMTLASIFQELEALSGLPAPRIRLPYAPILGLAFVCHGLSCLTGQEPLVPLEGVKMARRHMFFDSSRAVRELGLPQTPVETALAEAITWFRNHGYVR